MTLSELPDIEQTLGDLVLDLLRAPHTYPELILSEPDPRGEPSQDVVRLTHHYVMALLAYGFSQEQDELADATAWFTSQFPNDHHPRMDAYEMNRLEALLHLRPNDDSVHSRLHQLIRQRTVDGFFDIQSGGPDFDTLWALKVLLQAQNAHVLNGLVPMKDLETWSAKVVRNTHRDKDLALALRLRYSLAGKFNITQKRTMDNLLNIGKTTGGVWGVSGDMLWIAEHMRQHQLSLGEVADNREIFREMILSTLYVIENLMPLADDYAELRPIARAAVDLWWGTFHGKDAVDVLHALFPMPYDYLLIVSRTLVSLRAYLNKPLIQWGAAHIHRRMAHQQIRQAESPDNESVRYALRNWLQVDLEDMPQKLRLGMSDSNVVRVRPLVRNPMFPDDENARLHIPYAHTVIVKYGPIEEIQRERENYAALPNAIRESFVRIPQATHVDEQRRRAYVIMADLSNYQTLYEALSKVPQIHDAIARELGYFLLHMHRGDARQPRPAQWGLLWQLYLLPMQEHVERIFNYVRDNNLIDRKHKQPQANTLQRTLLDTIGNLVRYQQRMEEFPVAYMHGDLHTRNIMVRRLKRDRSEPTVASGRELDFKLIDLEKLRRDGDAALDAGELLVDLELAMGSLRGTSDRRPLQQLSDALTETYRVFAAERRDSMFTARMQLAKARAIIRVAKGRTKAGEVALRESRRGQAISVAHEVLRYAEAAAEHLATVKALLEQD
jgi:hypothetical protein